MKLRDLLLKRRSFKRMFRFRDGVVDDGTFGVEAGWEPGTNAVDVKITGRGDWETARYWKAVWKALNKRRGFGMKRLFGLVGVVLMASVFATGCATTSGGVDTGNKEISLSKAVVAFETTHGAVLMSALTTHSMCTGGVASGVLEMSPEDCALAEMSYTGVRMALPLAKSGVIALINNPRTVEDGMTRLEAINRINAVTLPPWSQLGTQ